MWGTGRSFIVSDFFGGGSKKRIIPHFSNNQESFSHYTELIDYKLCLAFNSSWGAFYWTISCYIHVNMRTFMCGKNTELDDKVSCLFWLEILFLILKLVIRTSNLKCSRRGIKSLLSGKIWVLPVGELCSQGEIFCVVVPFVIQNETQPGLKPLLGAFGMKLVMVRLCKLHIS